MSQGVHYAVVYDEKLLGGACEVEVVVELARRSAKATIRGKRLLATTPAFSIELADLRALREAMQSMKGLVAVLEPAAGISGQQLNCEVPGGLAIVTRRDRDPARYALSIGTYHREGVLSAYDDAELGSAAERAEALVQATLARLP